VHEALVVELLAKPLQLLLHLWKVALVDAAQLAQQVVRVVTRVD